MEEHNPDSENRASLSTESEDLKAEHGKKFARSQTDRIFLGICGGIAHYLDADPIIIRFVTGNLVWLHNFHGKL